MRFLLADRKGRIQAELTRFTVSGVVWRLNASGTIDFEIDRDDAGYRSELVQPGSWAYIEFDNGLPAWAGVLDLPREWSPRGVKLRAYTLERSLKTVLTPSSWQFPGVIVGTIFRQVINYARSKASIPVEPGHVWEGGESHWVTYHFKTVEDIIGDILDRETCDVEFVPYVEGGRIRFRANLHNVLGVDRRKTVQLLEGANVTDATVNEQGDIVNVFVAVGSGSTWAEREVRIARELESIAVYGVREGTRTFNTPRASDLARLALRQIEENARPFTAVSLTTIDSDPAGFDKYRVGDIVQVMLPKCRMGGYTAPVRIGAIGYTPGSGVCELACQEDFTYRPVITVGDPDSLAQDETEG